MKGMLPSSLWSSLPKSSRAHRTGAKRPSSASSRCVCLRPIRRCRRARTSFPFLAQQVLTTDQLEALRASHCCDSVLNMTFVGLHLSHYINGVTKRHGEVSRSMFPGYPIGSITNGVHSLTWTAPAFRLVYDRYIPDWRQDSFSLRYALGIPLEAIRQAHQQAKQRLIEGVNRGVNVGFDQDVFTLGFARRATGYKRPDLLFHDRAAAPPGAAVWLLSARVRGQGPPEGRARQGIDWTDHSTGQGAGRR